MRHAQGLPPGLANVGQEWEGGSYSASRRVDRWLATSTRPPPLTVVARYPRGREVARRAAAAGTFPPSPLPGCTSRRAGVSPATFSARCVPSPPWTVVPRTKTRLSSSSLGSFRAVRLCECVHSALDIFCAARPASAATSQAPVGSARGPPRSAAAAKIRIV